VPQCPTPALQREINEGIIDKPRPDRRNPHINGKNAKDAQPAQDVKHIDAVGLARWTKL
jgi:hypothetical protein